MPTLLRRAYSDNAVVQKGKENESRDQRDRTKSLHWQRGCCCYRSCHQEVLNWISVGLRKLSWDPIREGASLQSLFNLWWSSIKDPRALRRGYRIPRSRKESRKKCADSLSGWEVSERFLCSSLHHEDPRIALRRKPKIHSEETMGGPTKQRLRRSASPLLEEVSTNHPQVIHKAFSNLLKVLSILGGMLVEIYLCWAKCE